MEVTRSSFHYSIYFLFFLCNLSDFCLCVCVDCALGLFENVKNKKKKKKEMCNCMKSSEKKNNNCITIPTEFVALSALAFYLLQLMVALGCLVRI